MDFRVELSLILSKSVTGFLNRKIIFASLFFLFKHFKSISLERKLFDILLNEH